MRHFVQKLFLSKMIDKFYLVTKTPVFLLFQENPLWFFHQCFSIVIIISYSSLAFLTSLLIVRFLAAVPCHRHSTMTYLVLTSIHQLWALPLTSFCCFFLQYLSFFVLFFFSCCLLFFVIAVPWVLQILESVCYPQEFFTLH